LSGRQSSKPSRHTSDSLLTAPDAALLRSSLKRIGPTGTPLIPTNHSSPGMLSGAATSAGLSRPPPKACVNAPASAPASAMRVTSSSPSKSRGTSFSSSSLAGAATASDAATALGAAAALGELGGGAAAALGELGAGAAAALGALGASAGFGTVGAGAAFGALGRAGGTAGFGTVATLPGGGRGAGKAAPFAVGNFAGAGATRGAAGEGATGFAGCAAEPAGGGGGGAELSASLSCSGGSLSVMPGDAKALDTWIMKPHLRHFMRTDRPATFSSAIWYFALQLGQRNFIQRSAVARIDWCFGGRRIEDRRASWRIGPSPSTRKKSAQSLARAQKGAKELSQKIEQVLADGLLGLLVGRKGERPFPHFDGFVAKTGLLVQDCQVLDGRKVTGVHLDRRF
jgi:hypothetical protein